jgi:hydrogenase-4 component E
MTTTIAVACVALGLATVWVRSRTVAIALVSFQSMLLVAFALSRADEESGLYLAAGALAVRVAAIATILAIAAARTREPRPVRAQVEPLARLTIAIAAVTVIPWLVPTAGLGDTTALRGAISLVVLGVVIAMTRNATILQILGIVVAENGATLAALSARHAVPAIVELGVVFDLLLIAAVAIAFHARIFEQFGTADAARLRELRD